VQAAAQNFLGLSNPDYMDCGSLAYALNSQIRFSSIAGNLGLAEGAFVRVNLNVTPTIAVGNAALFSPLRSFFTQVSIDQGGVNYKQVHPFFFVLRGATQRKLAKLNQINATPGADILQSSFAAAQCGTVLPALATATPADIKFVYWIPFRQLSGGLAGMFPVGDSSQPLNITLTTPTALGGFDPEASPILVTGGDTVALNSGTIDCVIVYRNALTYSPNVKVNPPRVGYQVKVAQNAQAIAGVGADIRIPHQIFLPHTNIFTLIQDGNANPTIGGNTLGMMPFSNLSRLQFMLTDKTPVVDLNTANMFWAYQSALRTALGLDLPDGVFPYSPLLDLGGSGGAYMNPDLEILHQIPDLNVWRNSQTLVNIAAGTVINTNAGLARITTFSEYLDNVNY